jgi:hypothetical protein
LPNPGIGVVKGALETGSLRLELRACLGRPRAGPVNEPWRLVDFCDALRKLAALMGWCGNEKPTIPGDLRLMSTFRAADSDRMGGAWG